MGVSYLLPSGLNTDMCVTYFGYPAGVYAWAELLTFIMPGWVWLGL